MILETHKLKKAQTPYIESIFHFRSFVPDHSIERVVPTGHIFVVFELDGMQRSTFDNETLQPNATFQGAWVSGIHRNYLSISAHQNSEMFVIQFKAFGAHPFLHMPLDQLADRVVPGTELLEGNLLNLQRDLAAAANSLAKFDVAEQWLDGRFSEELAPPLDIIEIVGLLNSQPAAKLNEIVESFAGSQKHLIAQFKKYIGVTPKQYQRILRFNDVFLQMQDDQFVSWSDIAHRCGYSDQSHFIREFRHFSGFNPESFLSSQFDEDAANFFPLDRDG